MDNTIILLTDQTIPQPLLPQNIYSDQVHIDFLKKAPDTKCNGKVHRQLRYCRKEAGWGTDHFGKGRCKLHGGCCTGPKSGQLRYSDFVPADIVEEYEQFAVENDTDIKSLNNEIALIRAKITWLEKHNNDGKLDGKVLQFGELLRRMIESKQKCEEGIKHKIDVEGISKLIDKMIEIIDKHVIDIDQKKSIANDMRRLHLGPLLNNN